MIRVSSSLSWLGADALHLDIPHLTRHGPMELGCYGGCSSVGAHKNEDAALLWYDQDGGWEWAMVIDAHYSPQSAALLLQTVASEEAVIRELLAQPVGVAFAGLQNYLVSIFSAASFRIQCAQVHGEASCLLVARKDNFVWWFAVGDCVAYIFHPSYARLGEYALNQRHFYEWIGHINTFDLPVPCFTSGVRQLRPGLSIILLATDGLLECGTRPFEAPAALYDTFATAASTVQGSIDLALWRVHHEQGRDSATVIAWEYDSTLPSQI